VTRLPAEPSSYIEVWLIDAQVKGMISLGPFHGNGNYVIPSGVDPSKYPIVDVSLEPSDGVPTHSGVSIVRGVPAA
jgi:anti-sigma-K factor RskA